MSPTYVSKRLIGSGGAATLSIVSDVDVAVLAVDGCFDSGLSAVVDVLATANPLRQELPAPPTAFTVTIVGLKRKVRTGNGLTVNPVLATKMALVRRFAASIRRCSWTQLGSLRRMLALPPQVPRSPTSI